MFRQKATSLVLQNVRVGKEYVVVVAADAPVRIELTTSRCSTRVQMLP
jgi:hypothetical protein